VPQMKKDPFLFSNGQKARNVEKFLVRCGEYPQIAAQHLLNGHFQPWLTYMGREDLAQVADSAISSPGPERSRLESFVAFSKIANFFKESQSKRFTILLVGRTGVGKSSTINSLLGQEVAPVNAAEPETAKVIKYDLKIHGIPCRVIDTPGLCDGKGRDGSYIQKMRKAAGNKGIDCMWFVTIMDETRVRTDEIEAIDSVTEAFDAEVWDRAVIVLTRADKSSDVKMHNEQLSLRSAKLRSAIKKAIKDNTYYGDIRPSVNDIPVISVANNSETTPDGTHWLGELYLSTADRMSSAGFGSFFLATHGRLVSSGSGSLMPISSWSPLYPHSEGLDFLSAGSPSSISYDKQLPATRSQSSHSEITGRIISLGDIIPGQPRHESFDKIIGRPSNSDDGPVSITNKVYNNSIVIDRVDNLNHVLGSRVEQATGIKAGLKAIGKGAVSIADGCGQIANAVARGTNALGFIARRLFGSPL
jgi:small GTP-binding protein